MMCELGVNVDSSERRKDPATGSIVAAGAVVTKDVEPFFCMSGAEFHARRYFYSRRIGVRDLQILARELS